MNKPTHCRGWDSTFGAKPQMRLIRLRRVAISVLAFVAALSIGGAAYLYSVRTKAVLYRFDEPGNPVHEPTFAVFNPFRDRSSERQAVAFLQHLKEGRCQQALSACRKRNNIVPRCVKEKRAIL